jgi:hypothetical protein
VGLNVTGRQDGVLGLHRRRGGAAVADNKLGVDTRRVDDGKPSDERNQS